MFLILYIIISIAVAVYTYRYMTKDNPYPNQQEVKVITTLIGVFWLFGVLYYFYMIVVHFIGVMIFRIKNGKYEKKSTYN